MRLRHLWLDDFRNVDEGELVPAEGVTVVVGANGEGKTNLLEAVGYLATLSSFRGASGDALVRYGAERAVLRAEVAREDRELLLEAELRPGGRDRYLLNRQSLRRSRDLLGIVAVTVFSPDDLVLVKGGPANRRRWLDETLAAVHPRHDARRAELERVLKHRNALLRQAGGRLTPEVEATLAVWDAKLTELGEAHADARAGLTAAVAPRVADAYGRLAGRGAAVDVRYDAPWRSEGLAAALAATRSEELRRGVTVTGPHRDELVVELDGLPARTHASQGEQRSLALAFRLGAHEVVQERMGSAPVLLLDDVFSELDDARSAALVANLPSAQALLTTATAPPPGVQPDLVVRVQHGRLLVAA